MAEIPIRVLRNSFSMEDQNQNQNQTLQAVSSLQQQQHHHHHTPLYHHPFLNFQFSIQEYDNDLLLKSPLYSPFEVISLPAHHDWPYIPPNKAGRPQARVPTQSEPSRPSPRHVGRFCDEGKPATYLPR